MIQASHIHLMQNLRINGDITIAFMVCNVRASHLVRRILNSIENIAVRTTILSLFSGERKNLSRLKEMCRHLFLKEEIV
jgi:hypothetical protein